MNRLIKFSYLFVVIGFMSISSVAQSAPVDDDDVQSWNDISLTIAINKKLDLYIPFTVRFGRNIGRVNEGRVGGGFVIKPTKSFSITPFYTYIRYRNSAGAFKTEHRSQLRFVYKFPIKGFGLSHRSQFEYRDRPGVNTWRYRPSLTLEKDLPRSIASGLKLFVTEEPFYDSGSGRFSRNRFSFGVTKTLTKNLSLDVYYLRQGDNFSNPGTVDVIGTAWKVKL